MSTYKICLIILFSLTIFSCKKKVEDETPTIYEYISTSLMPYMFNNGSYWVYENDSTYALDSISLTSIKHGFFNKPSPAASGDHTNTIIEYYKINLHDFSNSTDYVDFLFRDNITRNGKEEPPTFGQPILLYDTIGSSLYGAYVWNKVDTMNICGNTFDNVIEMKIVSSEQTQQEFLLDSYLFFRDSIGIIKKVTDLGDGDLESWSLKRWKVNL